MTEERAVIPEWFCYPFVVTPECLYCPLSVTPEWFYQGSISIEKPLDSELNFGNEERRKEELSGGRKKRLPRTTGFFLEHRYLSFIISLPFPQHCQAAR